MAAVHGPAGILRPDFPRPREEGPSIRTAAGYRDEGDDGVFGYGGDGREVAGAAVVTLRLADGKTFTVTAKGLSKENKYVKSVALNGRPVTDWKISHANIVKGGELVFEMTNEYE